MENLLDLAFKSGGVDDIDKSVRVAGMRGATSDFGGGMFATCQQCCFAK